MQEFRLVVPTYNASYFAEEVERGEMPEYGLPQSAVLIRVVNGVRVVLGSHDFEDIEKPDILIERQPGKWMIFLHPSGGDPRWKVSFLDGGQCSLFNDVDLEIPLDSNGGSPRAPLDE